VRCVDRGYDGQYDVIVCGGRIRSITGVWMRYPEGRPITGCVGRFKTGVVVVSGAEGSADGPKGGGAAMCIM